jgi:hypothetical protein
MRQESLAAGFADQRSFQSIAVDGKGNGGAAFGTSDLCVYQFHSFVFKSARILSMAKSISRFGSGSP